MQLKEIILKVLVKLRLCVCVFGCNCIALYWLRCYKVCIYLVNLKTLLIPLSIHFSDWTRLSCDEGMTSGICPFHLFPPTPDAADCLHPNVPPDTVEDEKRQIDSISCRRASYVKPSELTVFSAEPYPYLVESFLFPFENLVP